MNTTAPLQYAFICDSLDKETFKVVNFSGEEALSSLFRFEITLISSASPDEHAALVGTGASLALRTPDGMRNIRGIISSFELLNAVGRYVLYKAVLSPKALLLTLNQHNKIFLQKNVVQFASEVLQDTGLTANKDFAFKVTENYNGRDYVCMYNENYFDFLSRWFEFYGMYFYFVDDGYESVLKIVDNNISHTPIFENAALPYLPPSGMGVPQEQAIFFIQKNIHRVPQTVTLKDYNYRTPALKLEKSSTVNTKGDGTFYFYGDHFFNSTEGAYLAKVRAGEYVAARETFSGESNVRQMRPGFSFALQKHEDSSMNTEYMLTKVTHQGHQEAILERLFGVRLTRKHMQSVYANSFEAIPADVQYRPPRTAPRPRVGGYINAMIDAAGSGEYAEIDDQGRYKVILPFDLSGRDQGNASCWLRMAQPHVGKNFGMHFPLHKGTEVLLSFTNGDPDRPVIAAAVPNPDTPSVVTSENQSKCLLKTSGGNLLHMENDPAAKRILMQTPTANTWLRIGAANDPPSAISGTFDSEKGISLCSAEGLSITCKSANSVIMGISTTVVYGINIALRIGNDASLIIGSVIDQLFGTELKTVTAAGIGYKHKINKLSGTICRIQAFEDRVKALDTFVEGEANRIEEESQNLTQMRNDLAVTVESMRAKTTKLYEQYNELAVQTSRSTLEQCSVAENENALALQETTVKGAASKLAQSQDAMNAASTSLDGAVTEMGDTSKAVAGTTAGVYASHMNTLSSHQQI